MSDAANDLYAQVCRHAVGTALLSSIEETLGWDERTKMPIAGGEHRAEQMTLLAGMAHQRWTDPKFGEQLAELAVLPLPDLQHGDKAVTVRRLKRQYDKRVKLPQTLVEELTRTSVLGQQAWQEARANNDFPAFEPLLEKMIGLKQQEAEALGYSESPYDALLDDYEPGELTSNVAKVLADLREQLVPLVAEIHQSERRPD
ncbi:MAG TPA: carboxypeptidase M32, partial [Thermoguttaceae bacterium]|nr:carboxypeptidase M32 [Thermoguttaceae bacterium]